MATLQIFLLGFCGYIFARRKIVSGENLKFLSHLVVSLLFPCFIFTKLINNFSFSYYQDWWLYPLLSIFITLIGFFVGVLFLRIDKGLEKFKKEFLSLVAFQNSGYLPLMLVALILPEGRREVVFVNIFLFLIGFDLVIWSVGAFYLAKEKKEKLEITSLFTPPIIADILALTLIAIGLNRFIPDFIMKPASMLGDCGLPLAIFVVGANLAFVDIRSKANYKHIINLSIAKLLFMPLAFLGLILLVKPPYEIAFLLLLQGTMPSATSLSVIMRRYDTQDNIISLGIFWTHILFLFTLPLLLTVFSYFKLFIFG